MQVLLYPEKKWAEFGAIRFELSTEIVRPEAMDKDEIDIDRDLLHLHWGFPTEAKARAKMLRLNARILEAFEDYCKKEEKRFTAVVEEIMLDYLKAKQAWPVKKTK